MATLLHRHGLLLHERVSFLEGRSCCRVILGGLRAVDCGFLGGLLPICGAVVSSMDSGWDWGLARGVNWCLLNVDTLLLGRRDRNFKVFDFGFLLRDYWCDLISFRLQADDWSGVSKFG